ncbi:MAG: hypothetical protein WCO84_08320, partial [bacterium]
MNLLFVAGTFNVDGGKPSGYARKLAEVLRPHCDQFRLVNGGTWATVNDALSSIPVNFADGVVIWFADVPNDKPKIVRDIKKICPTCILVTSKNNMEGKYTKLDLISRALQTKSNLLVEFTKKEEGFAASILDPLGNGYLENSTDINSVVRVLVGRLNQLSGFTRMQSRSLG